MSTDDAALRAEFDTLTARAGLSYPADRVDVMFDAFKQLRLVLAELHKPWAYTDEPAVILRLQPKEA